MFSRDGFVECCGGGGWERCDGSNDWVHADHAFGVMEEGEGLLFGDVFGEDASCVDCSCGIEI